MCEQLHRCPRNKNARGMFCRKMAPAFAVANEELQLSCAIDFGHARGVRTNLQRTDTDRSTRNEGITFNRSPGC